MESTKLDGDTGSDSNEWRECALIKGHGTFGAVDGLGGDEGIGVGCGGLQTDFYYIEWLT